MPQQQPPPLPRPLVPDWPGLLRCAWTALLTLMQPLVFLRLWWKGRKLPAYRQRWKERLGWVDCEPVDVWFHTVSVGEFNAALPLIHLWLARQPQHRILVTTTTPTGLKRAQDTLGGQVQLAHFPQDLPAAQKRFLRRTRPRLVVFLETEIWPNAWHACGQQSIPLALVNARLSLQSAAGYALIRPLVQDAFRHCALLSCQNEASLQNFRALKVQPKRMMVAGNLKYDMEVEQSLMQQALQWRKSRALRQVLVFASTHEGEESALLPALQQLRHDSRLLVVVPRHPERAAEVCRMLQQAGLAARLESELGLPPEGLGREKLAGVELLVVDRLGALMFWLASCDTCFMGGSLVPVGGHNVLEPAALGKAVFTGPYVHNFARIMQALEEDGGLFRIEEAQKLASDMEALLANAEKLNQSGMAARQHVMRHRGAVRKTHDALLELMQSYKPDSGSDHCH